MKAYVRWAPGALALLLSFVPVSALAQTTTAPIIVSECSGGIESIQLVEIASYIVTFRNTTAANIDEFRLAIPYGHRKTATFDVQGTFAPNTDYTQKLHKTLSGGLYAYESDHNTCNVQHVHFTDGTSWDAAGAKS
jgi:hypothetical protein